MSQFKKEELNMRSDFDGKYTILNYLIIGQSLEGKLLLSFLSMSPMDPK